MEKRVSSRGIIIEDDNVYAMFRRRIKDDGIIKEYYVIPGGGINENETLEENVIREMKEEFSVDVKIKGYLGKDESDETIAHFFSCSIINGTPKLGGEELERCTEQNYYEIRKVAIEDLDKVDILSTDMIMKAFKEEYIEQ
ncbi:MAG: NUDIX domain-containing protein [Tenericutes bacterium]|jgi:ADP-ribose pyrophosphatase YjhB (NUDIX family)|nr:NUDIX domain-containing protein [Mycoplasmatota bacterium]